MNRRSMRRRILKAGALLGTAALAPATPAHEYFTTRFTLIHPWTRASAPGATTAKLCMTFDEVSESDRLISGTTPLADTVELADADAGREPGILIPAGVRTEFSEAGTHVRLVRLAQPMELGREYPITLVFAKSGALRASFLVDYPAAG